MSMDFDLRERTLSKIRDDAISPFIDRTTFCSYRISIRSREHWNDALRKVSCFQSQDVSTILTQASELP